jgi:hypothetical protein
MFRSCWEGEGGVNFFVEPWKVGTAGGASPAPTAPTANPKVLKLTIRDVADGRAGVTSEGAASGAPTTGWRGWAWRADLELARWWRG